MAGPSDRDDSPTPDFPPPPAAAGRAAAPQPAAPRAAAARVISDAPDAPDAPADADLVRAMADGDEDALASFYDRHRGLVFAVALRVLHDRGRAEEVLVDVFHELYNRAPQFDPQRGNPLTFLMMIARSRSIDRLRATGRGPASRPGDLSLMPPTADGSPGPAQHAAAGERAGRIRRAIGRLTDNQREAIEGAFYGGLTHRELAEALRRPLGTIKSDIRRGLIRLRDWLAGEVDDLGPGDLSAEAPDDSPFDPRGGRRG